VGRRGWLEQLNLVSSECDSSLIKSARAYPDVSVGQIALNMGTVVIDGKVDGYGSNGVRHVKAVRIALVIGALLAIVAIIAALILIFHTHQCPPGWTSFDLSEPIGLASLVVSAPLLTVTGLSAVAVYRSPVSWLRHLTVSSLIMALVLMMISAGLALLLGNGAISSLGSSTNGCITF
jgi:hypothetical protein